VGGGVLASVHVWRINAALIQFDSWLARDETDTSCAARRHVATGSAVAVSRPRSECMQYAVGIEHLEHSDATAARPRNKARGITWLSACKLARS